MIGFTSINVNGSACYRAPLEDFDTLRSLIINGAEPYITFFDLAQAEITIKRSAVESIVRNTPEVLERRAELEKEDAF